MTRSSCSPVAARLSAALLSVAVLAGCVTGNTVAVDPNAPVPSWRSIGVQEAWLRVEGALAASQRSTSDSVSQRIVLENDTILPAENRIDLETSTRDLGRTVVEIEQVADRAAPLFGQIRTERLQQVATPLGTLFYIPATPALGTSCVFAFQRLTPGAGSLPSSARPIVMSGQNCVAGSDTAAALRPFIGVSVRPAAVVLGRGY